VKTRRTTLGFIFLRASTPSHELLFSGSNDPRLAPEVLYFLTKTAIPKLTISLAPFLRDAFGLFGALCRWMLEGVQGGTYTNDPHLRSSFVEFLLQQTGLPYRDRLKKRLK
jgi:hypothetical protein